MTGRWFLTGHRGFIEYRLNNFRDLIGVVSGLLERQATERQAQISRVAGTLAEDEADFSLEADHIELSNLLGPFPDHIRAYFLVSLYAYLEQELISICKTIAKRTDSPLRLNDIKGTGIFLAQKYLKKVARIEFPDKDADTEWREISKLNRIRNLIVHTGGIIEDESTAKEIREYVAHTAGLELENTTRLRISDIYLGHVLDVLKGFFDKLFMSGEVDRKMTTAVVVEHREVATLDTSLFSSIEGEEGDVI